MALYAILALYTQLALCVLHKWHCMHNWHCIHCIKGIACINGIVNSNSMTWDAHMAMNALLVLCRFNTQHCNTQIRNKQTSKAHHLVIVKLLIICWSFDDHLFVIQWQTNKQANEQSDHWFLIISLSSKDLIIVWPVISNHLLNIWWSSICYSMTKNKQTNKQLPLIFDHLIVIKRWQMLISPILTSFDHFQCRSTLGMLSSHELTVCLIHFLPPVCGFGIPPSWSLSTGSSVWWLRSAMKEY